MPARRRRFQVSGDPDDALLNLGDALKEMGAEDVTRSGPALTADPRSLRPITGGRMARVGII